MSAELKAIAFDLDDTLIRWRKPQRDAVKRALAAYPAPVDPAIFAVTLEETWSRLSDDLNTGRMTLEEHTEGVATAFGTALHLSRPAAHDLYQRYVGALRELVEVYEDVEAIRLLEGRYLLGVAMNGPGAVQREKLRLAGLTELLDFVVCSAEVRIAKPDPAFYDHVQQAARARADEILVVGNNVALDLAPAVTRGMHAVWVVREDNGPQAVPWSGPRVRTLHDLESLLRPQS